MVVINIQNRSERNDFFIILLSIIMLIEEDKNDNDCTFEKLFKIESIEIQKKEKIDFTITDFNKIDTTILRKDISHFIISFINLIILDDNEDDDVDSYIINVVFTHLQSIATKYYDDKKSLARTYLKNDHFINDSDPK